MIYMLSKRFMKTVHIIYIQETVFSACAFLARPEGATAYDLVLIWSSMCWNHVWSFYYMLLNKEVADFNWYLWTAIVYCCFHAVR